MSSVSEIIQELTHAARADETGDPKAHRALLECVQELTLAAEKPAETAKRLLYQPPTNAALSIAVELGFIDAVDAQSGPITALELAKQTHLDELLVVRIMRAIIAMGVCAEDGPRQYSPNSVTKEFTKAGLKSGAIHLYDVFMSPAAHMVGSLRRIGFRAPQEIEETPFHHTYGMSLFDWLKENPVQRMHFDRYMGERRKEAQRWFEVFPVSEQLCEEPCLGPEEALIVDVGGNRGHDLIAFKERYPEMSGRLILQDLPETLESMEKPLEGIETIAYDFFEPQTIKGARIYHFRGICHDWSDKCCIQLLTNTAQAMRSNYSGLLINDYVVPETGASLHSAAIDLQMMALVAGMERTESQWRDLIDACGLAVVKIWYSRGGLESVIETRLRDLKAQ